MQKRSCASCPRCGEAILLTTAAALQAKRRGVLCDCWRCRHEWTFRVYGGNTPGPSIRGPASIEPTPKSEKRKAKIEEWRDKSDEETTGKRGGGA